MWYSRDEWARDHEVLHPLQGVLYKSGVYAWKVVSLTPGDLLGVEGATEPRAIEVDRPAEVSSGHSR